MTQNDLKLKYWQFLLSHGKRYTTISGYGEQVDMTSFEIDVQAYMKNIDWAKTQQPSDYEEHEWCGGDDFRPVKVIRGELYLLDDSMERWKLDLNDFTFEDILIRVLLL